MPFIRNIEAYRIESRELDRMQQECESKQIEGTYFVFDRKTKGCNEETMPPLEVIG